jgi:hypothetical protein
MTNNRGPMQQTRLLRHAADAKPRYRPVSDISARTTPPGIAFYQPRQTNHPARHGLGQPWSNIAKRSNPAHLGPGLGDLLLHGG